LGFLTLGKGLLEPNYVLSVLPSPETCSVDAAWQCADLRQTPDQAQAVGVLLDESGQLGGDRSRLKAAVRKDRMARRTGDQEVRRNT